MGNLSVCNNPEGHIENIGRQPYVFRSIQEAVDYAEEWDEIYLHEDVYIGDLTINKTLTIYSHSADECIIAGHVTVTADDVTLSKLTISGGPSDSGLVLENNHDCKLNSLILAGNKNGILLIGSCYNKITGGLCVGNTEYGIKLTAGSNGNVLDGNWTMNNANGIGIFNSYPVAGGRNLIKDHISYVNQGKGLAIVDTIGDSVLGYTGLMNGISLSIEGCTAVGVGGGIGQSGSIGAQLLNSYACTLSELSVTQSGATDMLIDAGSIYSTIMHCIYGTILDNGGDTIHVSNHSMTPIHELDVATVGYVKENLQGTHGVFEVDVNGDLMPRNIVLPDADVELDEEGNLMPAEVLDIDENFEYDENGDIEPKE
jgi:hypothetical protein